MKQEEALPDAFGLSPNYPNPFNPATTITFALPEQAKVILEVYNIMGQKVATLVNSSLEAGDHRTRFEGRSLASGT